LTGPEENGDHRGRRGSTPPPAHARDDCLVSNRARAPWTIHVERSTAEIVRVQLSGAWRKQHQLPDPGQVWREIEQDPSVHRLMFDTSGITEWDSGLVTFAVTMLEDAAARGIQTDRAGLPDGVQRLLRLAEAVKERHTRPRPRAASVFVRIGARAIAAWAATVADLALLGDGIGALVRAARASGSSSATRAPRRRCARSSHEANTTRRISMSTRVNSAAIGAFVVGAIALLLMALLVWGGTGVFHSKLTYVLFLDSAVTGFNKGAPVLARGVKIGEMTDVQLRWGTRGVIGVYVGLEPESVRGMAEGGPAQALEQAVQHDGLRAQLRLQSFVTGRTPDSAPQPRPPQECSGAGPTP
jgi:hypothetical protein